MADITTYDHVQWDGSHYIACPIIYTCKNCGAVRDETISEIVKVPTDRRIKNARARVARRAEVRAYMVANGHNQTIHWPCVRVAE